MDTQIRIWRVVPTSQTGAQAPTYYVETTDKDRSKAEISALKQAQLKTIHKESIKKKLKK